MDTWWILATFGPIIGWYSATGLEHHFVKLKYFLWLAPNQMIRHMLTHPTLSFFGLPSHTFVFPFVVRYHLPHGIFGFKKNKHIFDSTGISKSTFGIKFSAWSPKRTHKTLQPSLWNSPRVPFQMRFNISVFSFCIECGIDWDWFFTDSNVFVMVV